MKAKLINLKTNNTSHIDALEESIWKKCSTLCSGKEWSYTSHSKKLLFLIFFIVLIALYVYITSLSVIDEYDISEIESKSVKFLISE